MFDIDDCPDYEEFMAERRRERRHLSAFLAHPDPRDPDHPGDEDDDYED